MYAFAAIAAGAVGAVEAVGITDDDADENDELAAAGLEMRVSASGCRCTTDCVRTEDPS